MKRFSKLIFSLLFIVSAIFILSACGPNSNPGGNDNPPTTPQTTYTVNFVEKIWVDDPETGGDYQTNIMYTTQFHKGENVNIPTEEYLRQNNKILYHSEELYFIESWFCDYGENITSTSFNDEFFTRVGWAEQMYGYSITTFDVYPNFQIKAQPIQYNLNGGTNNPDNPDSACFLEEIQYPTKDGYYFVGWTVSCENQTGTEFDTPTKSIYGEVGLNCVLTAHWELNQILFSGNANNGGSEMSTISYNIGENIELPTNTTFTKTNCSFLGWSTSKYEKDLISSNDFIPEGGTVTLYAIWQTDNLFLRLFNFGYDYSTNSEIIGYQVLGLKDGCQNTQAFIPAEFNGYKIHSLKFYDCETVTSITFENGGVDIITEENGNPTDEYLEVHTCLNLETIEIPQSTTKIDFIDYCFKIKNFILHNNITEIDYSGNNVLTTFTVPNTVTTLTLGNMNAMTSLVVPNTVEEIYLENLSALQELSIPTVITYKYNYLEGRNVYGGIDTILLGSTDNLKKLTITDVFQSNFTGFYNLYPLGTLSNLEEVIIQSTSNVFDYMFYNLSKLKTITLNENISYIGTDAFYGCTSLQSITMPKNITYFRESMFENCTSLQEINYTQNISSIPTNFAKNCISLKSFKFNCNVTIAESAFEGCSALTSFVNDNYITSVSQKAFESVQITSINLSNITNTTLPFRLFFDCSKLSTINIPATVKEIEFSCFANCVSLTDLTQFYNVETLSTACFNNTGITSVSFWDSLKTFSTEVFMNCAKLETIDFTNFEFTQITNYMFYNCPKLTGELVIPASVTQIGHNSFEYSGYSKVSFAGDVQVIIGVNAFANMTALTSFTSDNTLRFSQNVFYNSPNITNLVLCGGYVYYYDATDGDIFRSLSLLFDASNDFYEQNSSLYNIVEVKDKDGEDVQVKVPNKIENLVLKNVSETAGYTSSTLKTVTADNTEITINGNSFKNNSNLISVNIPNLKQIGFSAFENCSKLTTITSSNIQGIGSNAFYNCTALTTINTSKVTYFGDSCFYNCTSLKTVDFTACETISGEAFSKSGIESVCFGEKTSFSTLACSSVFADCTNLKTVDISKSTASITIPSYAFKNCIGLTSFDISNVREVKNYAFQGCSNIVDFNIGEKIIYIDDYSFEGLISVKSITIPDRLKYSFSVYPFLSLEELTINTESYALFNLSILFEVEVEGFKVYVCPECNNRTYYIPPNLKKLTINTPVISSFSTKYISCIPNNINEIYVNSTEEYFDIQYLESGFKIAVYNNTALNETQVYLGNEDYYKNFSKENCTYANYDNITYVCVPTSVIQSAEASGELNAVLSDTTLFKLTLAGTYYYTYEKVINE